MLLSVSYFISFVYKTILKEDDMIDEILSFNKEFVARKGYLEHRADKYPKKKLAILTCMDTRLTTLLPAALGLKNGDAKIIKNAGGLVMHPFDSAMRSLLIGVYELGVEHIMVIAHSDCGACCLNGKEMIEQMFKNGISSETIETVEHCGVDLEQWLEGFHDTEKTVKETVNVIRRHPLLPARVDVSGYIINSATGELIPVDTDELFNIYL